jgi:hypothetical protein
VSGIELGDCVFRPAWLMESVSVVIVISSSWDAIPVRPFRIRQQ